MSKASATLFSTRFFLVAAMVAVSFSVPGSVFAQTSEAAASATTPDAAPSDNQPPKELISPPASAIPVTMGPTVKEVEIIYVGPKSVDRKVILANMRTSVGQPYSPAAVQEDVRNLYATGFFTNLRISDEPEAGGVKVVVVVQPKPLVKEIVLNGYKEISEKRLKKEMKSKPGDPLSEQQIATDADKVKEYYQTKGFSNASVTYKIDVNEEFGRAVVTFNINEGARSWVTEVDFVGNKSLMTVELRKQMKTKKKDWLSFINKSGQMKEEQFREDLKKLRDYYQSKGYIDMAIKDYKFEYPRENEMTVVITVFEGIQYTVGKVEVNGNKLYDTSKVRGVLKMIETQVYSPQGLEADIKAIKDLYGQKGYIDTGIKPVRLANVESGKIDLEYDITEGPQSFVEKIIIQGNNKTKDKVLRRELALGPGDVYDSVKADASKSRLENLGYFSKVEVSAQETSVPNRKNMVVTVEEKRTGSVTFGIGFSSVDSLLGFVELSQGNFDIANFPYFTGAGQKFRARLQYGLTRRDFVLSLTEPWFLDQQLSFGGDLFYHYYNNTANQTFSNNQEYNQQDVGFDLRVARALNQFWTASLMYKLEQFDITDIQSGASSIIEREHGARTKSSVTGVLSYDTRDNVFLTRRGEKVSFTAEGAGGPLYGQTNIYKLQIDAEKWILLPHDLIFSMNLSTGVANNYGDSTFVPIFDRYFVGGSRSVRGFDNQEVGPKDSNGQPIGGDTYGYTNFELTFPIIDRVRGAVFTDAGFVDSNFAEYGNIGSEYSVGAGFGLRLNLPIGPLRLDLGFPIIDHSNNGSGPKFAFDVGYQF